MTGFPFMLFLLVLYMVPLVWFIITCVRGGRWGVAAFAALLLVGSVAGLFAIRKWFNARFEERLQTASWHARVTESAPPQVEKEVDEEEAGDRRRERLPQGSITIESRPPYVNTAIIAGFALLVCAVLSIGSFSSRGAGVAVAAFLALAAGGFLIWAYRQGGPAYVADSQSIERRAAGRGSPVARQRIPWRLVRAARYERSVSRRDFRPSERSNLMAYQATGQELVLLEAAGKELMRIAEPSDS